MKSLILTLGCLILWLSAVSSSRAQVAPEKLPLLPMPRLAPGPYTLQNLIELSLTQNPALGQAQFDIDAAQGKADQAGLRLNPTLSVGGEEVGRRGGIYTLPMVSQEIVTANKLGLSRAAALSAVDETLLALQGKRYALITAVRNNYFEILSLKRRGDFLQQRLLDWDKQYKKLEDDKVKKVIGAVGYLPFRIEANRLRIESDNIAQEYLAGLTRLATTVGAQQLAITPANEFGSDHLPTYPMDRTTLEAYWSFVAENHPDVRKAQVGIVKAEWTLKREQAQRVPNVTVGAGYQKNFNDRENQAVFQVGVPIPLFNRNQGNIRAAQAELARSTLEVNRVQNDLLNRLATAFGQYAAARQRAERLKKLVDDAEALAKATLADWQAPKSELNALQVAQSQRAAIEARLDYLRAWGDAWRAASEIAGFLLEENWPILEPRK